MARLDGKVALVTGAARGIGRAVCLRLAEEGAAIVATDLCAQLDGAPYPTGTPEDLAETERLVIDLGGKVLTETADVRITQEINTVAELGQHHFGGIDIVVAAAGTFVYGPTRKLSDEDWDLVVDVNLTGVFRTTRAVLPHMIDRGRGGSLIFISSTAGFVGMPGGSAYSASKHGLVGLARSLCNELAVHNIRTNTVHPTTADTELVHNDAMYRAFRPDLPNPGREDFAEAAIPLNALPIPWIDPRDVAHAVAWLAGDEARYVTGIALPVDAGCTQKFP